MRFVAKIQPAHATLRATGLVPWRRRRGKLPRPQAINSVANAAGTNRQSGQFATIIRRRPCGPGSSNLFSYALQRWFSGGSRTRYLKVMSLVLCPMSYTGGLHSWRFDAVHGTRAGNLPIGPPAALERSRSMLRHTPAHSVSKQRTPEGNASGVR